MTEQIYVPSLPPALKHPTVFKTFDALQTGGSFLLINDHDPIPLFYELKAERGNVFDWNKIEDGPETWKVQITKTGGDTQLSASSPEQPKTQETSSAEVFVLNVTLLEPRLKHPTIFKHFDALQPGEAFEILNDHDPKPLYYQLIAERGNTFTWNYIQSGPTWWQVQIRKNKASETVGQIVARDIRKAEVFKKYGIDFCCGGKKSLQQACDEAQVDVSTVEAALNQHDNRNAGPNLEFNKWEADFLTDYIYNQHHKYYYEEAPVIADLLKKVYLRHGQNHPQLGQLYELYHHLATELNGHFMKEEKVLFPFIKALVAAQKTGDRTVLHNQPSLDEPIQMMEADHEDAGDILVQIRQITDQYTPPQNSCNSFQLLYKKLEDLEADLHQHVHLENNVLFPKALDLEKNLRH